MKSNVAILSGKFAGKVSRTLGNDATNIPGVIARKIAPDLLKTLANQIEHLILITGTNGKTTTSNILASILRAAGKSVFNNEEGANLITGITACFVKHAKISGTLSYKYAVIEVDEAALSQVAKQVQPEMMVCTNFFRDQLDRFGEIDTLINTVRKAIIPLHTKLVLNGDDPLVMRLNKLEKKTVFFGMNKNVKGFQLHGVSESKFCPDCGNELHYEAIYYGQLGYYSCSCGFKRPIPTYEIDSLHLGHAPSFSINNFTFHIPISGIHNVYNALAAIACAKELGIENTDIEKGLLAYEASNGRMQSFEYKGVPYILNLVKNPAGMNITLAQLLMDYEDKQIAIILNDLKYDGTDISWIWDADLEQLNREDIKKVICGGTRAHDLALRIKYAGIDTNKIVILTSYDEVVDYCIQHSMKTFLLPNYTALTPIRKKLVSKMIQKSKGA
ncbi:Mur ligase family protein [Aneurinibacillus terranovensis]|uniref:Mur ligase family protein n=1 Tax=Aneurinibacillus terranovensis TaxID=278991 RepID=UPI0003FE5410|nr:Mur ligase family protein [Aneurinibacillus terranovensis]